jgi:hypothetical protein
LVAIAQFVDARWLLGTHLQATLSVSYGPKYSPDNQSRYYGGYNQEEQNSTHDHEGYLSLVHRLPPRLFMLDWLPPRFVVCSCASDSVEL